MRPSRAVPANDHFKEMGWVGVKLKSDTPNFSSAVIFGEGLELDTRRGRAGACVAENAADGEQRMKGKEGGSEAHAEILV